MPATTQPTVPFSSISNILRTKYAIFTGSHDREFRSLVIFPDLGIDILPDESFSLLMKYFSALPSTHSSIKNYVVLIDRRASDWSSVHAIISKLKVFSPNNLEHIYVLKPQGFLQRMFVTSTMTSLRDKCSIPIEFFDHVSDLLSYIDSEHLPTDMGGQLLFNLEDWIRDQMCIETFQSTVNKLCSLGNELVVELRTLQSAPSDVEHDNQQPQSVLRLNPCYAPLVESKMRDKRRQFLNSVKAAESEGLKIRQNLRDAPEDSQPDETEIWANKGLAFELPVDRVFHVINLEHILVRLTETRAKFSAQWTLYAKSVHLTHIIDTMQDRFDELQSLASIWGNLLEAALDYGLIRSGRSLKSLNSFDSDTHPTSDESSVDHESAVSDTEFEKREGLEAVLGRLREAEQLGNQLIPELQSLSEASEQLFARSRKADSPVCYLIRLQEGLDALAPVEVQSVSDIDTDMIEANGADELPWIRLPANTDQWPILFSRLLEFAKSDLPKTVDQLSRLHEMHIEIISAKDWLRRGLILIDSLSPLDKIKSLSLSETRKHLEELTAFGASREDMVKVLVDPKQFRLRFAEFVNGEMRATLRELLKDIEDVQCSCNSLIAALQQHISRSTFPRHTSGNRLESRQESVELESSTADDTSNHVVRQNKPDSMNALPITHESVDIACGSAKRLQLAWEEFINTERTYVSFLQHVHDVVWFQACSTEPVFPAEVNGCDPVPPHVRENPSLLLGNWPELLYFHRDRLLPALESCNNDASKLKRWSSQMVPRLIDLYSVYCSVHSITVQVAVHLERDRLYGGWMSACAEEVTRRGSAVDSPSRPALQLSSRLVTPVQRFQRYHLLIGQLVHLALTETDRSHFSEAHKAMLEMCETVNLTMRLRCLSIRPSELGSLLLRGDFAISHEDSRATQQRHVFLFTNAILLTKFRTSGTSLPLPRSGSFSPLHSSSEDGRERGGSNNSLSGVPLASNLASLVKSHVLLGNSVVASGPCSITSDSGPVYEIREELLLTHIGLTPCVKSDRRRFAIWTANRAQTYIFQSSDSISRDQWVRSINDLLMDQLRRLREEALQRQNPQCNRIQLPISTSHNQGDRSSSLPLSTGAEMSKSSIRDVGSVVSLPGINDNRLVGHP